MLNGRRVPAMCATALISAAVVLSACGSDSNSAASKYSAGFQTAAASFLKGVQDASTQVAKAKYPSGKVKGLDALKAAVERAAADFSRLKPTAAVRAEHVRLVRGFRKFAADITAVKDGVIARDAKATTVAVSRVRGDRSELLKTLDSIQSKIGG